MRGLERGLVLLSPKLAAPGTSLPALESEGRQGWSCRPGSNSSLSRLTLSTWFGRFKIMHARKEVTSFYCLQQGDWV